VTLRLLGHKVQPESQRLESAETGARGQVKIRSVLNVLSSAQSEAFLGVNLVVQSGNRVESIGNFPEISRG
jgi:hypothetical protein